MGSAAPPHGATKQELVPFGWLAGWLDGWLDGWLASSCPLAPRAGEEEGGAAGEEEVGGWPGTFVARGLGVANPWLKSF